MNIKIKFIIDVRVDDYGIPSDHSAVRICLKITLKQKKITVSKNSMNWDVLIKDEVKNDSNLN